jgi:hypothetical protein
MLITTLILVFFTFAAISVTAEVALTEPIGDIKVGEDEMARDELNLHDHFTDGGSDLSFSAMSNDHKIDINIEEDGSVDLLPPKDWFGAEEITFTASDGEQKVSDTVLVVVEPENDGPILISSLPDASFLEDNGLIGAFNLNDHFTDIDSLMTYSYSSENIHVNIRDNGDVDISTPGNWHGIEEVTFTATDGQSTASDSVTVNVTAINDKPQCQVNFESISLKGSSPSETLDLGNYFSDVEDEVLVYEVLGNEHLNLEIDQEKEELRISAPESWSGKEVITVSASDSQGAARSMQVVVVKAPSYDSQEQVFYLTGLVLGLAVVGTKLQFTSRRREIKSPVKLESYRHFKGR